MSKISVIIQREYISRVRKRSFIIMTILTPLLIVAIVTIPVLIATTSTERERTIAVIEDGSDLFRTVFPEDGATKFEYLENVRLADIKEEFSEAGYYGILHLSPVIATVPSGAQLITKKQPPIGVVDQINRILEQEIERQKLLSYDIENLEQILRSVRTRVSVQTILIDETGVTRESRTEISMALAYIFGFLMYMLVLVFGSQVMRGVIEEKTSRVVEVIVSSVKPVQLMMGKIVGIGMVGVTQFMLWISIIVLFVVVGAQFLNSSGVMESLYESAPSNIMEVAEQARQESEADVAQPAVAPGIASLLRNLLSVDWIGTLALFLFYFLTGYLLYASIFAAIGSAVDNETDTQQFMIPVTIPIMLGLFVMLATLQDPESPLTFWFSMIPLTSPIVMMARVPFGVPGWELALSMVLMVGNFLLFVWLAAKIYRTGILMYGKKSSYRELWRWMRYK